MSTFFSSRSPMDDAVLWSGEASSPEDIARCMSRAAQATNTWWRTPAAARIEVDATTLHAATAGQNIFVEDTAGGVAVTDVGGGVNAGASTDVVSQPAVAITSPSIAGTTRSVSESSSLSPTAHRMIDCREP